MTTDFESRFDPESMSDEELQRLVRQGLDEQETVDAANILVRVRDGVVHLAGRVGTDGERRIAERLVTDVIGVVEYRNEIVVDPIRRDEEPEAIDEHLGRTAGVGGAPLGRRPDQVTDESVHLVGDRDAELFGTHDVQQSIEGGTAYEPPDSPTQEGFAGEEADRRTFGEDH